MRIGDAKTFPLTAKVGRQESSYGDERLVGDFDWSNLGRVFDAAKLRYETADLRVDAFSGRVVIPRDDTFNTVNDYDWFSGIYASTKTLIPRQETQLRATSARSRPTLLRPSRRRCLDWPGRATSTPSACASNPLLDSGRVGITSPSWRDSSDGSSWRAEAWSSRRSPRTSRADIPHENHHRAARRAGI